MKVTTLVSGRCPICCRNIAAGSKIAVVGNLLVCLDCYKNEPDKDALTDYGEMLAFRQRKRSSWSD